MEESEKRWYRIGPRASGLVIGYLLTTLATFQLIFASSADIVSIFSGKKFLHCRMQMQLFIKNKHFLMFFFIEFFFSSSTEFQRQMELWNH